MCQSVIFGSLTLRNTNYVILGGNLIFQKFELSVTFDQNGQNAISADFEILAVNLPS